MAYRPRSRRSRYSAYAPRRRSVARGSYGGRRSSVRRSRSTSRRSSGSRTVRIEIVQPSVNAVARPPIGQQIADRVPQRSMF